MPFIYSKINFCLFSDSRFCDSIKRFSSCYFSSWDWTSCSAFYFWVKFCCNCTFSILIFSWYCSSNASFSMVRNFTILTNIFIMAFSNTERLLSSHSEILFRMNFLYLTVVIYLSLSASRSRSSLYFITWILYFLICNLPLTRAYTLMTFSFSFLSFLLCRKPLILAYTLHIKYICLRSLYFCSSFLYILRCNMPLTMAYNFTTFIFYFR